MHASVIRLRPKYSNHIWAIDFVHGKLSNGRPYKMLTPWTTIHVKPEFICSDNGPEFVFDLLQTWLQCVGLEPSTSTQAHHKRMGITKGSTTHSETKSLTQTGFKQPIKRKPQENCWIKEYYHIRPHQGLAMDLQYRKLRP